MRIHAIRTGSVRIKSAQIEGRGTGPLRMLGIFMDRNWSDWEPTFAWAIEHDEGVIVVDTGQATHLLLEAGRSLHPYARWEVRFRIEPEQEIGPQLAALGIGPRDIKRVVLTHLHMDHDGGIKHFPHSEILAARGEIQKARGIMGRIRGYLPHRWPNQFALMIAGKVDGVSPNVGVSSATLSAIRHFALEHPTVYLPTHDPDSGARFADRKIVPRSVLPAEARSGA